MLNAMRMKIGHAYEAMKKDLDACLWLVHAGYVEVGRGHPRGCTRAALPISEP